MEEVDVQLIHDLHPKTIQRRIHNLSTWLEAWTAFVNVILSAVPHQYSKLLGYQAIITDANTKFFYPDAWLAYDRQFQLACANDPARPWNVVDTDMWQLTRTGKSRPTCTACFLVHPLSGGGHCPFRPHSSQAIAHTASSRPRSLPQLQLSLLHKRPVCLCARLFALSMKSPLNQWLQARHRMLQTICSRPPKCTTVLSARPSGQSALPIPSPSPIREGRCRTLLAKHPDKTFVKYVLSGLDHGFTNGYPAQHHNLTCQNLLSAEQHHVFITAHLHTCCTNGETAGPISSPPIEPFHSSGVRAIPKKSGKLHLLHHLSDP